MSFVRQIEPDEAPANIQRIYDAGIKQYGLLYNNWKVFANAPHLLRPFTQFVGAVLNPVSLDKRTLELAILKTSLTNHCYY